jgi:hypothetical protein
MKLDEKNKAKKSYKMNVLNELKFKKKIILMPHSL